MNNKDYVTELSEDLNQIYSHLGVEAFLEKRLEIANKENNELKQQLEEKDKEIKQLKLDFGMFKSVNEFINNYGIDKAREVLLQSEKTKKQDKISFVVEHLEKVKEKILSYEEIYYQFLENGAKIPVFCVENFRVRQNIDNQIKQLKEGK